MIALMVMTPASLPEVPAFKVPAFDVPNIVATTGVPGTKTGGHQDRRAPRQEGTKTGGHQDRRAPRQEGTKTGGHQDRRAPRREGTRQEGTKTGGHQDGRAPRQEGTKTGGHQDGRNCNSYLAIGDTWLMSRSHLEAHFEPNCMNLLTILSVLEVTIQCPKWFRTFSPMMVIELVLLSDCHVLLFLTKLGMGTVNLLHFKKLCLHLCR